MLLFASLRVMHYTMKCVYLVSKIRRISQRMTTSATLNMPIVPEEARVWSIYSVDTLPKYSPHLSTFLFDAFDIFPYNFYTRTLLITYAVRPLVTCSPLPSSCSQKLMIRMLMGPGRRTSGLGHTCWLHRGGRRWQVPLSPVYCRGLGAIRVHL